MICAFSIARCPPLALGSISTTTGPCYAKLTSHPTWSSAGACGKQHTSPNQDSGSEGQFFFFP